MDGYMVGDSVEPKKTALEEAMAEIEEDMISKVKKDLTQYLDRLEKKVRVDRDLKDKAQDAVARGDVEEDLDEFAPPGGDDREPDEEEILRQLAAQWWNGTEQQMAKAQNTLAAMGWEIGPDESGDDDSGVYVYRIGDDDGRDTIAFAHSDLDLNEEIDTDPAAMQGPSDPGDTEVAHAAELDVANKLGAPQAPVATFEMADGVALECCGDDDQGYELRRGGKTLPSRFRSLDDAGIAVKLYQARRQAQQRNSDADYIEER
jgi:hypothetical protein